MKKSIIATSVLASAALFSSFAIAQTSPSGTATLNFTAKQSIDVQCSITAPFTASSGGATVHVNGLAASGDYPCGLLKFKSDIDVGFNNSSSATVPSSATISGIYLDTVYGECEQVGSLTASLVSKWVVVGGGSIAGILFPSTPAPCTFNGVITFS